MPSSGGPTFSHWCFWMGAGDGHGMCGTGCVGVGGLQLWFSILTGFMQCSFMLAVLC